MQPSIPAATPAAPSVHRRGRGRLAATMVGLKRVASVVFHSPWLHRATVVILYAVAAAGTVWRFRDPFVHNPLDELWSDPGRHWAHAKEPLTPSPWAIIDPPLYQVVLSVVQKWSLGVPALVACYEGALSAATPWLWYRFLRETLYSRTLAVLGWCVLAWLPSWFAIFPYLMTETLFLPLLGASLWFTMRARRQRTVSSFCRMVVLWLLTGLTRGIAIPLAGLAALWAWIVNRKKVQSAAISLAILLLVLVPLGVRNYHYLGLWSPIGTGWPNQIYAESGCRAIHLDLASDFGIWYYDFGSPSMYTKPLAPWSKWESRRSGVVSISIDFRHGSRDWQAAYERTVVHGRRRLWLRWENLILVMLGPAWPDDNPTYPMARMGNSMRWVWAPLFVVVLVAAAIRYRETLRRPLLPVLLVTWFIFQAVSLLAINEGRYRKPLEGLLVAQTLVLFDRRRPASRARRSATV